MFTPLFHVLFATASLCLASRSLDRHHVQLPIYDDSDVSINRSGLKEGRAIYKECECVPHYQCKNGKIITDGDGLLDPRLLGIEARSTKPKACPQGEICCMLEGDDKGETEKDEEKEITTDASYSGAHRCGIRNDKGLASRIMSDDLRSEAYLGEWPWQAVILKQENDAMHYVCGGVLIDSYHVLTVAHCVQNFTRANSHHVVVRLGEWDTQTTNEVHPHEDFTATSIHMHTAYHNSKFWNDIAVIRLNKKVTFKEHISAACLPKSGEIFNNEECFVTGWGKDAFDGGKYSVILKQVKLPIVPFDQCQKQLRYTRLGRFFKLDKSFICAGGEKRRDSCKGDGGGPLSCKRLDGSYALAGLVSWGIACGHKDIPGAYTNVEMFLPWIHDVTRGEN